MRRLFFPCLALVLAGACDPDLEAVKGGRDAGPEGGRTTTPDPVDGGGTTDGATEDDGGATGDGGTTHKVDGVDDFKPGEKFVTTSPGFEGFVAWDAARLYFGMSGTDVGSGASNKWVLVYLGVANKAGTTTGLDYAGEQQPTLPFDAAYHLRWKASGDYTNVQEWNGAGWVDASIVTFPIVAAKQGTFMEMSITRAALGNPTHVKLHMNMLIEGGGADWTFAGVPSTSFNDRKDPNYTKYFEFDLGSATQPNAYAPKPP